MTRSKGLQPAQDSGAPEHSTDYTTLVILHGYAWSSGIFSRFLPIAPAHNIRVILVDRRDYPASDPLTAEERTLLPELSISAGTEEIVAVRETLFSFLKERARELYTFLEDLVRREDLPLPRLDSKTGGIVLAGWSFAVTWMHAFLLYAPSFHPTDVDLSRYVHTVVCYDGGFRMMGFDPPADAYNPVANSDPCLTEEERTQAFNAWVSGYFNHGDTPDTLEKRAPLKYPPPSITTMTAEQIADFIYLPPTLPGGSDDILLRSGIQCGLWSALADRVLCLTHEPDAPWHHVDLRYVSCEKSTWESPYGRMKLLEKLEQAAKTGATICRVRVVRVESGNHFVHWDSPELALRALVGDENVV